jgi:hypothetical protein
MDYGSNLDVGVGMGGAPLPLPRLVDPLGSWSGKVVGSGVEPALGFLRTGTTEPGNWVKCKTLSMLF